MPAGRMRSAASVRFALRNATDEVHERLHDAAPFRAIAEGRLPRTGYARLLRALHHFHARLEQGCGEAWRGLPRSAARVPQLETDLRHLGEDVPAARGRWSPPATEGAALGCLYVAQGSTLGGRVIHRRLDYLFDDARGRLFFAGSAGDGPAWRALCGLLEQEGRAPDRLQGMIAGARAAFALFEHCLEQMQEECVHG
jgi:heme oxygenase (biliverdin-IX-beta and delta-forming)